MLVLLHQPPIWFMQQGCSALQAHMPFAGHELPSQQCRPRESLQGLPTRTQQPKLVLQSMPVQQAENEPEELV